MTQSLVRAWGYNSFGELGDGTTTDSSSPVIVIPNGSFTGTNITALAAGSDLSLAIQSGVLYAWGYNGQGQLGNNSTTNSSVPVAVSSVNGFTNSGVTAIAAGDSHNLALRNGAVYAWGNNGNGQLGNNSTTNSPVPVAVLTLSTGVTGIAAGDNFSLALQNGNVYAWGSNGSGQLGNGTTTESHTPVEVSFGGSVLSGIIEVAAAQGSSYALASDGSLYLWGFDGDGELGLGTTRNYDTPQHLLPPSGQYYELIDSSSESEHALALLGSTPPVPEPATWLGGLGLLATVG